MITVTTWDRTHDTTALDYMKITSHLRLGKFLKLKDENSHVPRFKKYFFKYIRDRSLHTASQEFGVHSKDNTLSYI